MGPLHLQILNRPYILARHSPFLRPFLLAPLLSERESSSDISVLTRTRTSALAAPAMLVAEWD
jgi:hypothetical protein